MLRVGIIGASGYAGAELIRYLIGHREVEITYLASGTFAGKPISEAFTGFLGQELPLCEEYDEKTCIEKCDFVFHTQGNGSGCKVAPWLLAAGIKVVDVPADFRLKDLAVHEQFYGFKHSAPELVAEAVYGIPELKREQIRGARIVANPGCYATASILALAPLAKSGLVCPNSIVIDAKSGVSGAGRSKATVEGIFCEVNEGFKAYAVATHRHTPEVEQELSELAGEAVTLNFTPHLVPMNRGILATAYASFKEKESQMDTGALVEMYRKFYEGERFICVLDEGRQPITKNVSGTNFVHIGVVSDKRTGRAIVTCAIDNMGKGAASQAIQNMNIMFGFDESEGISTPPVFP